MTSLLIVSVNAIALPMTGMEHSLQILAVVITMRRLVITAEVRKTTSFARCRCCHYAIHSV